MPLINVGTDNCWLCASAACTHGSTSQVSTGSIVLLLHPCCTLRSEPPQQQYICGSCWFMLGYYWCTLYQWASQRTLFVLSHFTIAHSHCSVYVVGTSAYVDFIELCSRNWRSFLRVAMKHLQNSWGPPFIATPYKACFLPSHPRWRVSIAVCPPHAAHLALLTLICVSLSHLCVQVSLVMEGARSTCSLLLQLPHTCVRGCIYPLETSDMLQFLYIYVHGVCAHVCLYVSVIYKCTSPHSFNCLSWATSTCASIA